MITNNHLSLTLPTIKDKPASMAKQLHARIAKYFATNPIPTCVLENWSQYNQFSSFPWEGTKFMYKYLKASSKDVSPFCFADNLARITCLFMKIENISHHQILDTLLRFDDLEIAFAYSAVHQQIEKVFPNHFPEKVQEFLIKEEGFDGALKRVSELTADKTFLVAMTALIECGLKKLAEAGILTATGKLMRSDLLIKHPFIQALLNSEVILPLSIAKLVMNKLIFPLEEQIFANSLLIAKLYTAIPKHFCFSSYPLIVEKYKHAFFGSENITSFFQKRSNLKITQEKIMEIPHIGIRKQILLKVIHYFYHDHVPMEGMWQKLHPLEKEINKETKEKSLATLSTKLCFLQLASRNPDYLIDSLKYDPFNRAVIDIFIDKPDWLETQGITSQVIYNEVLKLLKWDRKLKEGRLLIDSVQNYNLKKLLKEAWEKSL